MAIAFLYNSSRDKYRSGSKYGKEFNNERLKNHIPIIENDWSIRTDDSTEIQWSNSSLYNMMGTPEHIWKTQYFKGSLLVSEEDVFNYDLGDSLGYRLVIIANCQNKDDIKSKFSVHYYKKYPPSESRYVGIDFADSVLNAWNFKGLYK